MTKRNHHSIFIAWTRIGRRTLELSRVLNARAILIRDKPPYIIAFIKTIIILTKIRPRIVIAQLPQGPLLATLVALKFLHNYVLIADVHTGFLVYDNIKGIILNKPFIGLLKYCDIIILHNYVVVHLLPSNLRQKTLVVFDPMPLALRHKTKIKKFKQETRYIIVPASWAPDEPLEYIIKEYINSRCKWQLIITGHPKNRRIFEKYHAFANKIFFTGYLPTAKYYEILCGAEAVIAATTREYTMLSALWEALALGKPIIASHTFTLKSMLGEAAVYFAPNKRGSLKQIIEKICSDPDYIKELSRKSLTLSRKLALKFNIQLKELYERIGCILAQRYSVNQKVQSIQKFVSPPQKTSS